MKPAEYPFPYPPEPEHQDLNVHQLARDFVAGMLMLYDGPEFQSCTPFRSIYRHASKIYGPELGALIDAEITAGGGYENYI